MDFESTFEISRTADFIHSRGFIRVALQFPDELLKYSTKVVGSLKKKLRSFRAPADEDRQVGLFIMADTTYGSCCVDEVAASHVDADCVVHYGQTCLSPTSTLPAFFVFGKASINISAFVAKVSDCALTHEKPILVLYGLEYSYALPQIKEKFSETLLSCGSEIRYDLKFADVICSIRNPSEDHKDSNKVIKLSANHVDDNSSAVDSDSTHIIGGLVWNLPQQKRMEDYVVLWIGPDNSAFANVVLTYNSCEIVRYDAGEDLLVTDVSDKKRILRRRYYLVEKAKDSNMVGILVGTLGVAGYLETIHRMKELVMGAGKKAYTLVMGKPNPAKLANFPECDVFIYVSCAQTALLDSKEFFAPVITPFEAMLAFNRGSQWTGKYMMGFQELVDSRPEGERSQLQEARYSFIHGGYVEDFDLQENREEGDGSLALANATQKALQLRDKDPSTLVKGMAKSGAEFFVTRSYHGLEIQTENSPPEPYAVGRSGRASGYIDENSRQGNHG